MCAALIAAAALVSCTAPVNSTGEDQPPPVMVPVVPNESIVTARIIAVNSLDGPLPWELVIEIINAEDVAGLQNLLKDKTGQTIAVRTEEDMEQFSKNAVITAHVKYEGDERSRLYFAYGIANNK